MPYDPFKHHRRSIRLKGYDYSQTGAYFVTICAQNRECLFGKIVNGEMNFSAMGTIAVEEWSRSPQIRHEIELDEWIIMPNHIHGIVIIAGDDDTVGAHGGAPNRADDRASNRADDRASNRADSRPPLQRRPKSLGSFVAGFKSSVTTRINQLRDAAGTPIWQRNYYEHIIRNERELNAIRTYIQNNPANWAADMDNLTNAPYRPPAKTVDDYLRDVGIA